MIYVIIVVRRGDGEWEILGHVQSDTYPVEVVDRIQKDYGLRYSVSAVESEFIHE